MENDEKTTGAGQADGIAGDDSSVTTAQEQAWFDEDDDGGTGEAGQDGEGGGAAEDGGAAEGSDGKPTGQPADDGDGDGKPATAEAGKDTGRPADDGKPAETAKPQDGKPAGAAADADGSRELPSPWDLDAAVGKALAEPMPDKVKVGDSEVDVKQFLADFPEVQAVAATMARRVVEQVLEPILPAIHVANQVQAERYHAAFMGEVDGKFPGASEAARSPEFKGWIAKQPKPIQDMASVYDVDSAVFVLQQFRAAVPAAGQGNGKPPRQAPPASPAFQRRKEALAGTMSGKPATPGAGDTPAEDYESAFNED